MNIYVADTSPLISGDVFDKYYNEMSDARRNKIDKLKNDTDKRLSLCAGILINRAFCDIGRRDLLNKIAVLENGRPGLPEAAGIDFNVSHSGDMAVCVLSDSPVGCDIQLMKPTDARIAKRFFSEDEKKYVFADDNPSEITDRFYKIWTRKEAFTKLTGEGIMKDFQSFSVLDSESFWEKTIGNYRLCVAGDVESEQVCLFEVDLRNKEMY